MMVHTSIQNPMLLPDAVERAYSMTFMNDTRALSLRHGLRAAGRAARRAAVATGRFVADVINAQAEARARDQRYSHTAW